MRNELVTPFWQKAAAALPEPYRSRYAGYFERAERWELAVDALVDLASRVGSRIAKAFNSPTRPHSA